MSAPSDDALGFAPDCDSSAPYMQRTRDYYTAIGYTTPYRWTHYIDAQVTEPDTHQAETAPVTLS